MAVLTAPGTNLFAVRYAAGRAEDWRKFAVGKELTETIGGTARVFAFGEADVRGELLVAKLYKDAARRALKRSGDPQPRLVPLVRERDMLHETLPFCVWPRRVLFDALRPPQARLAESLLGFSMEKISNAVSLYDLLFDEAHRRRLTPDDYVYIGLTIARQLSQMHMHAWKFLYVDMSPNNILVSHDFRAVRFIDTDSFQFTHDGHVYKANGLTEGFTSPGAQAAIDSRQPLTPDHDRFCLAILLFHLLMARQGRPVNPFEAPQQDVNDFIEKRAYLYAPMPPHAVRPELTAAYKTLSQDIRDAFLKSFTATPLTARDWAECLSRHRGFLQCA